MSLSKLLAQERFIQEHIIVDPAILVGKPVVKGTRIPVELVLHYLADNFDLENLFAAFPRLTLDDVKACIAYAQALVAGEDIFPAFPAGADAASAHPE